MGIVFREKTRGNEPAAQFTQDAQEVTRTFLMYDDSEEANRKAPPKSVSAVAINRKVAEILGTTLSAVSPGGRGTPGGAGCMRRLPPWADGPYPTAFAESVSVTVQSDEMYEDLGVSTVGLAVPPVQDKYAAYHAALFTVRFVSRPFPILPDARMTVRELDFFDFAGVTRHLYWYPEYLRYAWAQYKAMDVRLQATQATGMVYRAQAAAGTLLDALNNTSFSGVPEMAIDDTGLTIHVVGVPQRYVDSAKSYLRSLKGTINSHDFWRWKKACLFYQGFTVDRTYTPFRFELAEADDPAQQGSFATEQLVDLSLEFILTSRKAAAPAPPPEPVNPNWIADGHNLLPNVPAKIYLYVSATFDNPADRTPSYRSVPFQLLFMDPDADLIVPPLP